MLFANSSSSAFILKTLIFILFLGASARNLKTAVKNIDVVFLVSGCPLLLQIHMSGRLIDLHDSSLAILMNFDRLSWYDSAVFFNDQNRGSKLHLRGTSRR